MSLRSLIRTQTRNKSSFKETLSSKGNNKFVVTPDRYHIYMSYACPFAHRVMLVRALKGLNSVISASALWVDKDSKYIFSNNLNEGSPDYLNSAKTLQDVYRISDSKFRGNATVPVLFDRNSNQIVNNESEEIMRILNSTFNGHADYPIRDFYPQSLTSAIDGVNEWVDRDINVGVYLVGAASKQSIYEKQTKRVFDALDKAEEILSKQRYICGEVLTEADLRLFPSLVRFDAVYYTLFHCNIKQVREYEHLSGYMREIYQIPGVDSTLKMDHIKAIYWKYRKENNPKGILPIGPTLDLSSPHGRGHLNGQPFNS